MKCGGAAKQIPCFVSNSFHELASSPFGWLVIALRTYRCELRRRQRQVGSLDGAAHLLTNNTGVLRSAQWERKYHVEHCQKHSDDIARPDQMVCGTSLQHGILLPLYNDGL
jgi:hypothetical protein